MANWPAADQSYVTNIHNDCPNEYAYAYDDPVGLHQCATGSNYTITFCPNGSGSTGGTTTTATPTFSPAAGTYSSAQTVAISDTTSGAKIYYTTNGTTPTISSTLYSAAITVSATETVEAIAAASGDSNSAVATAAYTISTSGGSTLANGTYTVTPQNATALRLDDSGAKTTTGNPIIVYTSNGTGAQNWVTTNSGVTPAGYYNLATEGAYCMTVSGTTSGSAVVLDPCAGTTAQAWEAVASGSFYVLHPGNNTALCLTASGTTSGNAVDVDTCSGATSQEWAF